MDTYSIEELRDLAALDPDYDTRLRGLDSRLTPHRMQVWEEGRAILTKANGRALLASEQRQFDRCTERLNLLDTIIEKAGRRWRQAAELRAQHAHLFGPAPTSPHAGLGYRLANAIGEVREEGRSTAYVDLPETRTLLEAGPAGAAVPTQLAQPVQSMRARSVMMGLPGLRIENMTSDRMIWPRIGSATTAAVAEAGTLTSGATDVDAVTVVAAKYGVIDYLSTELEEDMSAPALEVFGGNLISWLALKVDQALLEGTGAGPGIVGIRNTASVNTTSVAATLTLAKFRAAEYELRLDNGNPAVWVMHPRTWKTAQDIVTGISGDVTTVLEPNPQVGPRTLLGYPVAFSSQITLTEGATNAGSWAALIDTSQLVVCERRHARLEVSRDLAFDTDRIAIRCTWRGGLAVLNPEAISLLTDIRV